MASTEDLLIPTGVTSYDFKFTLNRTDGTPNEYQIQWLDANNNPVVYVLLGWGGRSIMYSINGWQCVSSGSTNQADCVLPSALKNGDVIYTLVDGVNVTIHLNNVVVGKFAVPDLPSKAVKVLLTTTSKATQTISGLGGSLGTGTGTGTNTGTGTGTGTGTPPAEPNKNMKYIIAGACVGGVLLLVGVALLMKRSKDKKKAQQLQLLALTSAKQQPAVV